MSGKCCCVEDNEALVDNSDHVWAQLGCTDTKLKYYSGEFCVSEFFIIAPCLKNVCDGCMEIWRSVTWGFNKLGIKTVLRKRDEKKPQK